MTQHAPKQMALASLPLLNNPSSLTKIHLQLLAGGTFHAPVWQFDYRLLA